MKVGFVAEHPDAGVIGGAERAIATLTKALLRKGVDIHYFSRVTPTQPHHIKFHKVKFPLNPTSHNLRKTKIPTRLVNLMSKPFELARRNAYFKSLSKENCDVHVQVCAGQPTGYVAHYCNETDTPFIFRSTCLWDADLTFQGHSGFRKSTRQLYLYGLENADAIVPNNKQTTKAFQNYQKLTEKTCFIPDGFNIPKKTKDTPSKYALWVGRNAYYKQPRLYVKLAEKLPQHKFVMVGDVPNSPQSPANLRYTGRINNQTKLASIYRDASFIVNTSMVEGFPNVLVEAGMYSKPYIGFFDPDGVVKEFNLGFQVEDFDDLLAKTDLLMKDKDLRCEKGLNARRYVETQRDVNKTVLEWLSLFKELT